MLCSARGCSSAGALDGSNVAELGWAISTVLPNVATGGSGSDRRHIHKASNTQRTTRPPPKPRAIRLTLPDSAFNTLFLALGLYTIALAQRLVNQADRFIEVPVENLEKPGPEYK